MAPLKSTSKNSRPASTSANPLIAAQVCFSSLFVTSRWTVFMNVVVSLQHDWSEAEHLQKPFNGTDQVLKQGITPNSWPCYVRASFSSRSALGILNFPLLVLLAACEIWHTTILQFVEDGLPGRLDIWQISDLLKSTPTSFVLQSGKVIHCWLMSPYFTGICL